MRTVPGTAIKVFSLCWLGAGTVPGSALADESDWPPLEETFAKGTVSIETAAGPSHTFDIYLALTSEQRARGLMGVTELPANQGMLFDFGSPRPVSMWMKDTPLPLDMLFIRPDGSIFGIAANTTPESQTLIPSLAIVRAVLELNGGTAERLGIASGDRVEHEIFRQPSRASELGAGHRL